MAMFEQLPSQSSLSKILPSFAAIASLGDRAFYREAIALCINDTKEKHYMMRVLPLFASVAMVAFSGSSAMGATLVGSELNLRVEIQRTPTSELLVNSFPASAIVSESAVEFPNAQSLGSVPGFSIVNVAIDAGADYLAIDFDNVGIGTFTNTFKNSYIFAFSAPVALQITDVLIDPSTTLGLTSERVTFDGNELSVNVQGLRFNSNSFARLNLSTVAAWELTSTSTDIPSTDVPSTDVPSTDVPSTLWESILPKAVSTNTCTW